MPAEAQHEVRPLLRDHVPEVAVRHAPEAPRPLLRQRHIGVGDGDKLRGGVSLGDAAAGENAGTLCRKQRGGRLADRLDRRTHSRIGEANRRHVEPVAFLHLHVERKR